MRIQAIEIVSEALCCIITEMKSMKSHYYNMRKRSHDHEIPNRTHAIKDCNFLIRLLYDC